MIHVHVHQLQAYIHPYAHTLHPYAFTFVGQVAHLSKGLAERNNVVERVDAILSSAHDKLISEAKPPDLRGDAPQAGHADLLAHGQGDALRCSSLDACEKTNARSHEDRAVSVLNAAIKSVRDVLRRPPVMTNFVDEKVGVIVLVDMRACIHACALVHCHCEEDLSSHICVRTLSHK